MMKIMKNVRYIVPNNRQLWNKNIIKTIQLENVEKH